MFDFGQYDVPLREDAPTHNYQQLAKQAHFKDNTTGPTKYRHHSIYGESIGKNDDIKEEMYDSKYRTFIKEKDSDEEESKTEEHVPAYTK